MEEVEIIVRTFDPNTDGPASEAIDRMCEVGPSGEMSLFTDLLGDPVSRIRNSPAYLMLVAETTHKQIVGLVRGCVKSVTCGNTRSRSSGDTTTTTTPIFTQIGYILGLRVSPSHRRMGIGLRLVSEMEQWFRSQSASYSYMATDTDNKASVSLFTSRLSYAKFRTPAILVHPVFAGHRLPIRRFTLRRLSPPDATLLYRRRLSSTEFFPRDIDAVLANPLSLGTFLLLPKHYDFQSIHSFLTHPPESWSVASVWDCKSVFHLEIRGASRLRKGLAWVTRAADRAFPWLRIPSVPDLFRPFGLYFVYGMGGEGPDAAEMAGGLFRHAHNLAREGGCGVVAAEVACCDPLRRGIPYWRRLSCEEDLWCVKRLAEDYGDGGAVGDWTKSAPGTSIFVDPREF